MCRKLRESNLKAFSKPGEIAEASADEDKMRRVHGISSEDSCEAAPDAPRASDGVVFLPLAYHNFVTILYIFQIQ